MWHPPCTPKTSHPHSPPLLFTLRGGRQPPRGAPKLTSGQPARCSPCPFPAERAAEPSQDETVFIQNHISKQFKKQLKTQGLTTRGPAASPEGDCDPPCTSRAPILGWGDAQDGEWVPLYVPSCYWSWLAGRVGIRALLPSVVGLDLGLGGTQGAARAIAGPPPQEKALLAHVKALWCVRKEVGLQFWGCCIEAGALPLFPQQDRGFMSTPRAGGALTGAAPPG